VSLPSLYLAGPGNTTSASGGRLLRTQFEPDRDLVEVLDGLRQVSEETPACLSAISRALGEFQPDAECAPQFATHNLADERCVLGEHVGKQIRVQPACRKRREHDVREAIGSTIAGAGPD